MDKMGEPVPQYRLTKEQKNFQKTFGRLRKIRQLLEAESMRIQYESKNVTDLWLEINKKFKTLQPPPNQVRELDGMNFQERTGEQNPASDKNPEDLMIRY